MENIEIAYRLLEPSIIPPRVIKVPIPGWGGIDHTHKDGSKPQPWHCIPFIEGNTYGLELIFPYEEQKVTRKNGQIIFDNKELAFKSFTDSHYGYQAGLDLKIPINYVLRLEPHPSYFIDDVGTVPCMVPGHLQTEWWTRFFFIVFKAPLEGQTHIFRKNEPYGQILVVPQKINYNIRLQTSEEKIERKCFSDLSLLYDSLIGENSWKADNGIQFNDKYKVLLRAYNKNGKAGIEEVFKKAIEKSKKNKFKIKRKLLKTKNYWP